MIDVQAIYASIQGEGAMTGTPMIVLRLMGCGVGCVFCDTKETWDDQHHGGNKIFGPVDERMSYLDAPSSVRAKPLAWSTFHEEEVVEYIAKRWPRIEWVLVTGGEPAEQKLQSLVELLHAVFRRVAIETSGTALGHLVARGVSPFATETDFDWVCVSPKINNPAGKSIRREAIHTAHELKFVIGKQADIDVVSRFLDELDDEYDEDKTVVSLQPMWGSLPAVGVCTVAALEHGWRLSLQVHKYIGLP